jgi:hypothetical protein
MKYKLTKLFIICCIVIAPLKSFCSDFLPIFYVNPVENDLLNANSISSLKSKIINFITKNGISGDGGYSDLVIYPVVNTLSESEIEAMQNLKLYSIEIQLIVKEVKSNIIYNSISIQAKGDGYNKKVAVQNAINSLSFNNQDCQDFIITTKSKIIEYYTLNCSKLLEEANAYSEKNQYEKAISICYSIPSSVNCYKEALKKSLEFYVKYSETNCKNQLLKAQGYLTDNQYSLSISTLSSIDPNTSCYSEAISNLNEIKNKIQQIEQQKRDELEKERLLALEIYKDEQELEKLRIAAVKDIATEYYRNQPKTVYQYSYIIR